MTARTEAQGRSRARFRFCAGNLRHVFWSLQTRALVCGSPAHLDVVEAGPILNVVIVDHSTQELTFLAGVVSDHCTFSHLPPLQPVLLTLPPGCNSRGSRGKRSDSHKKPAGTSAGFRRQRPQSPQWQPQPLLRASWCSCGSMTCQEASPGPSARCCWAARWVLACRCTHAGSGPEGAVGVPQGPCCSQPSFLHCRTTPAARADRGDLPHVSGGGRPRALLWGRPECCQSGDDSVWPPHPKVGPGDYAASSGCAGDASGGAQ